jgi:hypothetical protein
MLHIGKYLGFWMLIVALFLLFSPVHSQTTTITQLAFPSEVLAGSLEPIPVSVVIPYNGTRVGYWLMVGIFDPQLNNIIVQGNAFGSPNACVNQPIAQAFCLMRMQSTSGIENVQFKIGGIFASARLPPGTWKLQVTVELVTLNNTILTRSDMPFSIYLAPVSLTVDLPRNVTVWVDGIAKRGSNIPIALGPHSISVPMFVPVSESARLRFDHWSDGLTQPNRTVFISSNMQLAAVYLTQYRLLINRNAGPNVSGAGWYDDGAVASFSVTVVELPTGGLLDLLGARLAFRGWFEDDKLITSSASSTVKMSRSHTITAQWRVDYTMPIIFFIVVGGLCLCTYLVIKYPSLKRKSLKAKRRRVRH